MTEDVMTVQEVAELLRVSSTTVYTGLKAGDIPGRKVGQQWRLSRVAVMAWLAGQDDLSRVEVTTAEQDA